MNDQQFAQLTNQLADIELPPEPNWWPWLIALVAVIVAALLLIFLLRRREKKEASITSEALQRLNQLEQSWQSGKLDQRRCAYQLATLLRLGLRLPQLNHTPPAQLAEQNTTWQQTITLLQQLRYQANSDAQLSDKIFTTIRTWLQQGEIAC
jgi:cytochrome c-type biogenesis protein CcmH/NrfF